MCVEGGCGGGGGGAEYSIAVDDYPSIALTTYAVNVNKKPDPIKKFHIFLTYTIHKLDQRSKLIYKK